LFTPALANVRNILFLHHRNVPFIVGDMNDFPIIEKLGGREAAIRKLQAEGVERVSPHAARMWVARGRLPGHVMQALMTIAERERVVFSSADFALQQVGAA